MSITGSSGLCGIVFPVGRAHCMLSLGLGGSSNVGLEEVNGQPLHKNPARQRMVFECERWYRVRLRVAPARIQAWIDHWKAVDLPREGRAFAVAEEYSGLKPLGLVTRYTGLAVRKITVRRFEE